MKEDKTKQGENDDMKEYAENEVKDSKKKNNNKSTKKKSSNVLPILIILLIVSILISGLIIYNSQRLNNSENIDKVAEDKNIENKTDISNGMKRYTSSKYSIEFDYPAELIFIDDLYYVSEKPEDGKLAALSIAKDGGRNPLVYMSFLHLNNNNCEIQSIIEDIEWEGDYILGKVVIDGVESDFVEGYKSFEEGISSYYKEICYINDEKSVSIRFVDDEANSNKLILDDFLKSINFIEWKTYTNTNLNFLISYPENWEIDAQEIEDENPENGEKIYGINLEISNMGYKFVYDIPAGGFGGQKCVYGDEEFDGPQVQLDEYYMELLKGEDRFRRAKVVNNYDDTKIAYQICGGGNNDFYSDIVYDGRVSYYFTGSISQDMLDLLDQIFLSMEKLDWKTYENDEYGISLSYPSDWELEETDDSTVPSNPLTVRVSKGNSFFNYTQPLLEAMYCYYGTGVEEGVGGYSFSNEFEEFNNNTYVTRRSMFEDDNFMINEEGEKYGICRQDNEDYIYGVFEGFVYYNIDENATNKEELLETMDAIFLTMEGVEQ